MILISVIVPVYNVENYLERCINSIINQTYKNIEIILVNDGSTDKSKNICNDFKMLDNRIKVIDKKNGGLSDARNCGIKLAKGDYILFVDSDDYIDSQTCEVFSKKINELGEVDIITGNANIIENSISTSMKHTNYGYDKIVNSYEYLKNELRHGCMHMAAVLNLYNRKFLINNNLFFKKGILHEDEELVPKIFLAAKSISHIDFLFYYYEIRNDSITQTKDLSKNAIDLYSSLENLEIIYDNIDDEELKILLKDSLAEKYLNMFQISKNNTSKQLEYSRDFVSRNAKKSKTKWKSFLFGMNKNLYFNINDFKKRIHLDIRILLNKENIKYTLFLLFSILLLSRFFVFNFNFSTIIENIYMWLSRFMTMFIIYIYLKKHIKDNIKPDIFIIGVFILYVLILIINLFNGGEMRTVISNIYPIISVILVLKLCFGKNFCSTIVLLNYLFLFLLCINIFLKLFLPYLFGEYMFFLGTRNQIGVLLIINILISYIYDIERKSKIFLISSIVLAILTTLVGGSANNLIALVIILSFLILKKLYKFNFKKISILKYIGTIILSFYSIVILKFQNIFSFFIEDILQKSLSFSGRTYIWDVAINKIIQKPFLGYGRLTKENYFYVSYYMKNGSIKQGYYSAHNTFLQMTYESGVIPIIVFLVFLYIICNKIKKYNSDILFFLVILFSIFIINLMEAIGLDGLLVTLAIYYFYSKNKYETGD